MTYIEELKAHWRPILAAMLGLGVGNSLAGTILSALAPSLIATNHWSPAAFAAVGSIGVISAVSVPAAGRLTDLLGVRWTATIGLIAMPLIFVAYSLSSGSLSSFIVIFIIQGLLCGTTTASVYSRLPVQFVHRARGAALALVASGPAIAGAILGPLLNAYVDAHGWRASYQALAIFTAIGGVVVFFLIPTATEEFGRKRREPRKARQDYRAILKTPAFQTLAGAALLCNLPHTIFLSQLKLLLLANGIHGSQAGIMFSMLSVGMIGGRVLTGLALDRFPSHLVACLTMGMPSIGMFLFASHLHTAAPLAFGVFCLGFAVGAEGDVLAYLVGKHFAEELYSSVLGLLIGVVSISATLSALLLSASIAITGGFELFLIVAGTSVLTGSTLLLRLKRGQPFYGTGVREDFQPFTEPSEPNSPRDSFDRDMSSEPSVPLEIREERVLSVQVPSNR